MEKVEEAEVNEKTEEGTPLHVASESVMEVLRESRENIQSIQRFTSICKEYTEVGGGRVKCKKRKSWK